METMAESKQNKCNFPPETLKRSERLKKSKNKRKEHPVPLDDLEPKAKKSEKQEPSPELKKDEASDDVKQQKPSENSKDEIPPTVKSPEPNCAICLSRLENKSFTDSCFHMFCFVCLMEWSKIKAECPLCKQAFKSIIHNVRSYEDYDQYHLERQESQASWENPNGRRFRYRTTVTQEHIFSFHRYADILHPAAVGARFQSTGRVSTRQNWRRQRQVATSEFRSRIYRNCMRVKEIVDTNGRQRDITPAFFSANPAAIHRLIPWLNRELNALLNNHEQHVQFLIELITGLIKRFDIQSEEFYQHVYPFIGIYTRHFMEEFQLFARCPFSMTIYDTKVIYEQEAQSVSDSDSDGSNDSDVMILSPSASTGMIGAHSVVRRRRMPIEPPVAERRWYETEVTPRTVNLRDLLEDNTFSTPVSSSTGLAGWDSPIPGPSWGNAVTANEINVSTTEDNPSTAQETKSKESNLNTCPETKVKLEQSSSSQVINSDSDSDEVIFVRFDRPWQERSPLIISSDDEAPKEENYVKYKTDKHPKKKSSKNEKPRSRRSRCESYSSEEPQSSISSYSRSRLQYIYSHHKRQHSRSLSPSKYYHKKFSRSSSSHKRHRHYHRSRESDSADDLIDNREHRRSDSMTSRSSRRSMRHKRSYHYRDYWDRSVSRSYSRSPKRKRTEHQTKKHKSRSSESKSRDLTVHRKKDNLEKHKKHRKHESKHKSHLDKKHKSHRKRNKDLSKESHKSKSKDHEKIATTSANKIIYSDVSDDSISFSYQTSKYKKHPSGHKKSKKNETEDHNVASRNFTAIKTSDSVESERSDFYIGNSKQDSANESASTKESYLDAAGNSISQADVTDDSETRNLLFQESVSRSSSGSDFSSSSESGMTSFVVRKGQNISEPSQGENSTCTPDVGSSFTSDTVMPIFIQRDLNSSEDVTAVSSTTMPDSRNESSLFPGTSFWLDSFYNNAEQQGQTSHVMSSAAEPLTIDSSSSDSTVCVSSSSEVPADSHSEPIISFNNNFSYVNTFRSILDKISPIIQDSCQNAATPGSRSDLPCNVESDGEIEVNSDSNEEIKAIDFSRKNSVNLSSNPAVSQEITNLQQTDDCSKTSEKDDQNVEILNNNVNNFDQNALTRPFGLLSRIDRFAVLPSRHRSTDNLEVTSEEKPLDLSVEYERNCTEKPFQTKCFDSQLTKNQGPAENGKTDVIVSSTKTSIMTTEALDLSSIKWKDEPVVNAAPNETLNQHSISECSDSQTTSEMSGDIFSYAIPNAQREYEIMKSSLKSSNDESASTSPTSQPCTGSASASSELKNSSECTKLLIPESTALLQMSSGSQEACVTNDSSDTEHVSSVEGKCQTQSVADDGCSTQTSDCENYQYHVSDTQRCSVPEKNSVSEVNKNNQDICNPWETLFKDTETVNNSSDNDPTKMTSSDDTQNNVCETKCEKNDSKDCPSSIKMVSETETGDNDKTESEDSSRDSTTNDTCTSSSNNEN